MGREIRRVPPTWKHPTYREWYDAGWGSYSPNVPLKPDAYTPLQDKNYNEAMDQFVTDCLLWREGKHEAQLKGSYSAKDKYLWENWEDAPDSRYCRNGEWCFTPEQATAYQIYETVSEGAPVSPVFETLDAMRDWLIKEGYSETAAQNFCQSGYVPSMMVYSEPGKPAVIYGGIASAELQTPTGVTEP